MGKGIDDKREAYKLACILASGLAAMFLFAIGVQIRDGVSFGGTTSMAHVTRIEVDGGKPSVFGETVDGKYPVHISGISAAKVGSLIAVDGAPRGGEVAEFGHNRQLITGRLLCLIALLFVALWSGKTLWLTRARS